MKILFITKGDRRTASSRQRVWEISDRLRKVYGYHCDVLYSVRYISEIRSTRKRISYDIIFVHKSLYPISVILYLVWLRIMTSCRIIYDLDDGEWIHSWLKTVLLVCIAHKVSCGSHEIYTWANHWNSITKLIPTSLDYRVYKSYSISHGERDTVTIGWVGHGPVHFRTGNFEVLQRAFNMLAQDSIKFRFVLIGSKGDNKLKQFFKNDDYKTIFIDELNWYNSESVPNILKEYNIDIGVAPLLDTPFNKAKCGFKAIEYMALGIPVVASPVGEHNVIIEDGMSGILPKNDYDWYRALSSLISYVSERSKLGTGGAKRVRDKYALDVIIQKINICLLLKNT